MSWIPEPWKAFTLSVLVAIAPGPSARAELVFDLPDLVLQPNQAAQSFFLSVENTGSAIQLTGLQLELMVEDGGPQVGGTSVGPAIRGGSVTSPGLLFAANNNGETGAGNFGGLDQLFQLRTSTASGSISLGTGRFNVATLILDTTGGIAPGVYQLSASSLNGLSFFTGTGSPVEVFPTLAGGTLTVIPEPTDFGVALALTLGGFAAWGVRARARR